jgi:hypothetical protein
LPYADDNATPSAPLTLLIDLGGVRSGRRVSQVAIICATPVSRPNSSPTPYSVASELSPCESYEQPSTERSYWGGAVVGVGIETPGWTAACAYAAGVSLAVLSAGARRREVPPNPEWMTRSPRSDRQNGQRELGQRDRAAPAFGLGGVLRLVATRFLLVGCGSRFRPGVAG